MEETSPLAGPAGGALSTASAVCPLAPGGRSPGPHYPLPPGPRPDSPTAPAFLLLARLEVQGGIMQGPGAHGTWVSPWPPPRDAPGGTPPPGAQPLTWVPLPPPYTSPPPPRLQAQPQDQPRGPGQCPPEIHLLRSWAQAEEVSQQEGGPRGQRRLAQPEEGRAAPSQRVGAGTGWQEGTGGGRAAPQ